MNPGSDPRGGRPPNPPATPGTWGLRVDTGGTFTDCLGRAPDGTLVRAKVLSTGRLRGRIRACGIGGFQVEEGWNAPDGVAVGMTLLADGTPLGRVHAHARGSDGLTWLGVDPLPGRVSDPRPGGGEPGQAPASGGAPSLSLAPGDPFELSGDEPAPLLAARLVTGTPLNSTLPPLEFRLATTRGTNALLERKGAPFVLVTNQGFGDVLTLGDQARPELFSLDATRPPPLYREVVEVGGRVSASGEVLEPLEVEALAAEARALRDRGIEGAAVCLLHAWANPEHEEVVARILEEAGLRNVVRSGEISPFLGFLRRAETAAVEAFLGPVVGAFLDRVSRGAGGARLRVMTSAGGLVMANRVRGCDTLLSGPAGGVLGALGSAQALGFPRILSFDMGGTSTDVARADGHPDRRAEHQVGDTRLRAPAVAIETVAAGGGSICRLGPSGPEVGPDSAGADPGPACYGRGGPLTLTDVNLLLGRVDAARFGIPVDPEPARRAASEIARALALRTGTPVALEELLEGFLALANERMADAMRRISVQEGYDPADHVLVAFGGAGPQHATSVAERLGVGRVLVPPDAGILSAVGLDHAVVERYAHRQVLLPLEEALPHLGGWMSALGGEALEALATEGIREGDARVRERTLHLRYQGQEATLEVPWSPDSGRRRVGAGTDDGRGDLTREIREAFEEAYRRTFGHLARGRTVELAALRVVAEALPSGAATGEADPRPPARRRSARDGADRDVPASAPSSSPPPSPAGRRPCHLDGGWDTLPVFDQDALHPGATLHGPALVNGRSAGTVLPRGWQATRASTGTLVMERAGTGSGVRTSAQATPVEEELFVERFRSLAGEMGAQLQRTALSVNIRERLDYSCALLDPEGRLVANAPHIPVHLGALGRCVRQVAAALPLGPGDVAVSNHPGYGGSHLPDVTVITPVFAAGGSLHLGYVASRAHHAEIGGSRPGSMPPDARSLAEEGVVIAPRHLVREGVADWEGMEALLRNPPHGTHPSRGVAENRVDLEAQVAANHRGAQLLQELARDHGVEAVLHQMSRLRNRAATRMRAVLSALPDGTRTARESLDDGTPLEVSFRIEGDRARVDFAGSGGVHPGNLNATPAIVSSAVLYVLRLLAGSALPLNEGLLEPVTLSIPRGLLNPDFPPDPRRAPAVVGGNTEVSQRLVDALLRALELVAGGQGTMNNVLFGDRARSYYETVGGGAGAGPGFHGASGVQVHMTNTRITDVEVLEHRYPVRVERFALRRGSGGAGRWRGGDGIIREITFLEPLALSVLGQHRVEAPYGLAGGHPGATGRHQVIRADGSRHPLAPVDACEVAPGDRLLLETPGGGGYGAPEP